MRMQMRVCRPAYTACDLFIKPDCLKEKKHPSLVFFCFHHLFIIYLHRSHSAFAFHINSSLAFTLPHKYFFPLYPPAIVRLPHFSFVWNSPLSMIQKTQLNIFSASRSLSHISFSLSLLQLIPSLISLLKLLDENI